MKTYAYGFPRLGKQREFKKLIEGFWASKVSGEELLNGISRLQKDRKDIYKKYVNYFPANEMTLYDQMLDASLFFGVHKATTLNKYFELCRGKNALEMTKWFNTNYHYLVPNFEGKRPSLKPTISTLDKIKDSNISNIFFLGPLTLLKLSKNLPNKYFEDVLVDLVRISVEFFEANNISSVHLEDPAFVMDLSKKEIKAIQKAYELFEKTKAKINLFTYYDSIDNLDLILDLPINGLGVDLVHDRGENYSQLKKIKSTDKVLFAGVVDGRNVWRDDLFKIKNFLLELSSKFNVVATNAAPLYHLPISLEGSQLPNRLLQKMAFAEEKLYELKLINEIFNGNETEAQKWTQNLDSPIDETKSIQEKVKNLTTNDFIRTPSYRKRTELQKKVLNLPEFPSTTIGSFPQTEEVRKIRLLYKNSKLSEKAYKIFIRGEIAKSVQIQEDLGLDVLVHGEFERTDMVEYFAEKLEGIATTKNGWIISYGTRCYRPPIIYGSIKRTKPMTVDEISFAQQLTNKPVKGMLTGPITILSWSYVRKDISIESVAFQLSLAFKEEIKDYEDKNIKIIQIDEPAFREKAPIKKRRWREYFKWATKAFRLCHSSAKPQTQIHTHMCYSEFGEIMEYIVQLDFDVISIEASRSKGDIIESFERVKFDRQIGLGVWDIHSPAVPGIEDIKTIVNRALKIIPKENFWINPDCGLKTRQWNEVIPSLQNMIELTKALR